MMQELQEKQGYDGLMYSLQWDSCKTVKLLCYLLKVTEYQLLCIFLIILD